MRLIMAGAWDAGTAAATASARSGASRAPQSLFDPEPRRILLVRLSHLGDVVHALPVFHALRERWPAAEIGWVVQPEFADLLRGLPGLTRTFLFERRGGWRAWPRLRRELREFAPDWAVDVQGNLKSAAVTLCARARHRIGAHRSEWREPLGAFVLNAAAPPPGDEGGRPVHAVERMLALARWLTGAAEVPARMDVGLSAGERAHGSALVARWLPAGGGAPIVLNLAAPADVRAWPAQHFAEIARRMAERGRAVLCLSGPAEREVGEALARELRPSTLVRHWVGQRGLRELAAFFDACARERPEARLLTGDTGPMHLAAAHGMRVVALSGPQDAARTGPWPAPTAARTHGDHVILRARSSPACAPCFSRRCRHPEGPVCMSGLGVDEVIPVL